jgi:lysine 6-dehydrogenase
VSGQRVSPREFLEVLLNNMVKESKKQADFRGHMVVHVKGKKKGKNIKYTIKEFATETLTKKMRKKGVTGSYRTGIYGAIGTILVGRGIVHKKGVYFPEACIPPKEFFKEAIKAGIRVEIAEKTIIDPEQNS